MAHQLTLKTPQKSGHHLPKAHNYAIFARRLVYTRLLRVPDAATTRIIYLVGLGVVGKAILIGQIMCKLATCRQFCHNISYEIKLYHPQQSIHLNKWLLALPTRRSPNRILHASDQTTVSRSRHISVSHARCRIDYTVMQISDAVCIGACKPRTKKPNPQQCTAPRKPYSQSSKSDMLEGAG